MEVKDNTNSREFYEQLICKLADSNDDLIFANDGPVHAAVVFSNIFRKAESSIYMFAGNLNGDVSNDAAYLKALENYLANKLGSFSLILEELPSSESKAFRIIKKYKNLSGSNIDLFKINMKDFEKLKGKLLHFIVADNKMFRFEQDASTYKALCSFNSEELAQSLVSNFFLIKDHSEPLLAE